MIFGAHSVVYGLDTETDRVGGIGLRQLRHPLALAGPAA